MMERIKSVILGLLVLTSLALTYTLWYGVPPYEVSEPILSERIHFSNPRSVPEIIVPSRVVYRKEDDIYHVFFPGQQFYQTALTVFRALLPETRTIDMVSREAWLAAREREGVMLDFKYPYPLHAAAIPEMPKIYMERFFVPSRGREAWVATPAGDYYRLRLGAVRTDLLQEFSGAQNFPSYRLAGEEDLPPEGGFSFSREIYLPLEDVRLPIWQWKREDLDMNRLNSVFFIDMSMVRRIEEKDGAVIYTDGKRGVRIYPGGAVEYTTAGPPGGLLSGEQALAVAGEIIALYGGWAADLYLWLPPGFISPQSRQQISFVPYMDGKPLLTTPAGISLSVTERGVRSFFRNVLRPVEEPLETITAIPGEAALLRAIEYLVEERDWQGSISIRDIYPGYYLRDPFSKQTQAQAVWFVEFERAGLVVINAGSGLPSALHRF